MTQSNTCLLQGSNLCFKAGYKTIVNSVDINIHRSCITAIIGPNGGGKTALLKMLCGINRPFSGQIVKKSGVVIGYIPQKIHINPMMPMRVKDFVYLYNLQKDRDWQNKVLDALPITNLWDQEVCCLSGGEMQYVLLARAMLKKPDILILDEPTNHMDVVARSNFYKALKHLRHIGDCGIVCASHDVIELMNDADYVVCINKKVCCQGCPLEVCLHPEFLGAFKAESLDCFSRVLSKHK